MQGIVICHHKDNDKFLKDLLESIDSKYKVVVYTAGIDRPENSFELGAIHKAKEVFKEFILLQDTTLIKDNTLFDKLFAIKGNVFITDGCYHYMGKFVSVDLNDIPSVTSKEESIQKERNWLNKPYTYFTPDLPVHTDIFEEKYGLNRMKLENDYMIKWKATFNL